MPRKPAGPNVHAAKRVVVVLFLNSRTHGRVLTKSTITAAMEEFQLRRLSVWKI
uniref:Uncharacterized protein n=1 Tax=Hyaloperonospora arabidopsidis (strain Emoy2) TaxID=559515 RepID=M4BKB6_HYAAE